MEEKSCRCGASKKRFKMDIGPFYVGECCEAAGYDGLGNPKGEIKKPEPVVTLFCSPELNQAPEEVPPPGPSEGEAPEAAPEEKSTLRSLFGSGKLKAGGRGKLMDMTSDQVKAIAAQKGIEVGTMNKKQIVAAILEKP
jgi:hypothetical protein